LQYKGNNAFWVCIVELHVSAKYRKTLRFAQQRIFVKLVTPAQKQPSKVFMQIDRYFCSMEIKFGFSQEIFIEARVTKFGNPTNWSCADTRGQTDGHDEAN